VAAVAVDLTMQEPQQPEQAELVPLDL